MGRVRLAIAGVGNCASSLVQGLAYYGAHRPDAAGLLHERIGPYTLADIEVVAAFDVDARKVGRPLEDAIFAPPNCALVFQRELSNSGVIVQMAPVLDGIAPHVLEAPEDRAPRVSDAPSCVRRAPTCWSATCRWARSRPCATSRKRVSTRASRS